MKGALSLSFILAISAIVIYAEPLDAQVDGLGSDIINGVEGSLANNNNGRSVGEVWDKVKDKVGGAQIKVKEAGAKAIEWVKEKVEQVKDKIGGVKEKVKDKIRNANDRIKNKMEKVKSKTPGVDEQ